MIRLLHMLDNPPRPGCHHTKLRAAVRAGDDRSDTARVCHVGIAQQGQAASAVAEPRSIIASAHGRAALATGPDQRDLVLRLGHRRAVNISARISAKLREVAPCDVPRWYDKIGAPGFEPGTFWSQTRRATGLRYAPLSTVPK